MPFLRLRSIVAPLMTVFVLTGITGCEPAEVPMPQNVARESFGDTPEGEAVELFTVTNANGLEIKAITYGGIIISLKTPDNQGNLGNIVLGFDNLQAYLDGSPYFGAIVGRYGNRIGGISAMDR